VLQPAPDVISEILEDEVIMIDLKRGIYYRVKGSGAAIWRGVAAGASIGQVCATLGAESGHDAEIVAAITSFVDELLTDGLLVEVPDGSPVVAGEPLPVVAAGAPFEPPVLERFDDMTNVLLADPIHDVDPEQGWPIKP
jgi:hypothetical protein